MMSSYFSYRHWLDENGKDHFFGSASRGGDCLRVCQSEWNFAAGSAAALEDLKIKKNPALWLDELPAYLAAGVDCLKVPGRDRSNDLVRDIVRFYRRVLDRIAESDAPDLSPFRPQLENFHHRWKVERGSRDRRLIGEAEQEARRVKRGNLASLGLVPAGS